MSAINCVYRFLDKEGDTIYVGKTINLAQRLGCHLQVKNPFGSMQRSTKAVEYIEFDNDAELHVAEVYFINKFKPKYNKKDKVDGTISFDISVGKDWKSYESDLIEPFYKQDTYNVGLANLRTWRERRQFTQETMARRAGLTTATISRYENKGMYEVDNDRLKKVLNALGIGESQLTLDPIKEETK